MNRQQQINALLARGADDARRLALDEIDARARQTSSFGSREHREARDRIEKHHDDERHKIESLSDDELERALAVPAPG